LSQFDFNAVMDNVDRKTVSGFGDEWSRFPQDALGESELQELWNKYFSIFPWDSLPAGAVGADFGCGSGRWSKLTAPRAGKLHLLDPSAEALAVAKRNLADAPNVTFHNASITDGTLPDESLDFAFSLGVLHHVPDTERAFAAIARTLKKGAPLLTYLYYAFDNRPAWFRALWQVSDVVRRGVSQLPHGPRYVASQALAGGVYWPLARSAKMLDRVGALPKAWPLAFYKDESFYTMRTDALDRFGTSLEKRYTRVQITELYQRAGFSEPTFSTEMPHWVAYARKL
jgi:SAM-dependent methyltransferase